MLNAGDHVGEFELIEEIGRGAMGTVWSARQETLKRTVAIKFLKAGTPDETLFARFEAEAAQAARLSHPGILPVYAFGRHLEIPWFAMELVRGKDLADVLKQDGPVEPRRAAEIIRDAARALHHAHEQGIIHRDVKPANILLREDGRIAITDFGLSKESGGHALTTTGLMVGTPYYLSPEAISGDREQVGPLADVYALGVTLYELLIGQPPFQADSALGLIHLIGTEAPPRLRAVLPVAPKALETLVDAAMQKNPADRPPSAAAFADELDRFLTGEEIETAPQTAKERAGRFVGKHRLALGIGAAAAVVVIALVAIFASKLGEKDEELAKKDAELAELENAEEIFKALEGDEEQRKQGRLGFSHVVLKMSRKVLGWSETKKLPAAYRERWTGVEPIAFQVKSTPPDAVIQVLQFPDAREWKPLADSKREPGFYRFIATAEGHRTTIWTALIPPGTNATFEVDLPTASSKTDGMLFYAGFWMTPMTEPMAAGLERSSRLPPYYLDTRVVTMAQYSKWVMGLSNAEQARMRPGGMGRRGPRGRGGRARPPRGDGRTSNEPMRGLNQDQVRAFADAQGKRLPTERERANAYLVGALAQWSAKKEGANAEDRIRRLAGPEGLILSGRPAEWVEGESGVVKPLGLKLDRKPRAARAVVSAAEAALRLAGDAR